MASKAVLVVEDDVGLRRLVRLALASEDYSIIETGDGDEAWALLEAHRPAVAVLDVVLPGRNGFDLTYAIKQHPDLRSTYVILLTALARQEHRAAAAVAGADEMITKPFSPRALYAAVTRAFGQEGRRLRGDGELP